MKTVPFYDICADFYDADYAAAEREDDAAFYAGLAREAAGPVLERGCGSGRVLVPCARAGAEMVGMDLSAAMLERLRLRLEDEAEEVRRRVETVQGDMCDAAVTGAGGEIRTFPLVTAPFRVIQHLVERRHQRAWLRNVARHLAPGGALVFDVFQPDFEHVVAPPTTAVDLQRTDPETGRLVQRHATAWHTPELQTFRVRFEWTETEEGAGDGTDASESRSPGSVATLGSEATLGSAETTVRWFTLAELTNLLELEGFRVTDAWGDFDATPYGPGAEEIILRAVLG